MSQSWEDIGDQGRNKSFNMNTYRVGGDQKPSGVNHKNMKGDAQTYQGKKTKDASDPRFKRIISQELKRNSDKDEMKKKTVTYEDQLYDAVPKDKIISVLKAPKNECLYTKRFQSSEENSPPDSTELVTKDPGLRLKDTRNEITSIYSKALKNDFNRISPKSISTDLKKSASDCTLQRKTLFGNQDIGDLSRIRLCPSGSEIISEKGCKPVRKRSVVTVIGQAQTKPLNVLLQINQRRKLAKELDKHAMCEAIVESNEVQTEIQNLLAQVDFVLPDGKVIYTVEKTYLGEDKHKDCGECLLKSRQNVQDEFKKRREMIPEKDSSVSQIDKKSRPKRSSKKLTAPAKESSQLKECVKNLRPKFLWVFCLILFCLGCAFASMSSTKALRNYYPFRQYFAPKTMSWYEKLLY